MGSRIFEALDSVLCSLCLGEGFPLYLKEDMGAVFCLATFCWPREYCFGSGGSGVTPRSVAVCLLVFETRSP